MTLRILITGGQGFVGSALATGALTKDLAVRVSSRQKPVALVAGIEYCHTGDLGAATDWCSALAGIDVVVHCAGRAHVMNDSATDPLTLFRTANVEGTVRLARQAVAGGVKRFVYISSVGVNGVKTTPGRPFTEIDEPSPHNAYAVSKREAELALLQIATESGMEVVIIRPPLVYGVGAPGNFGALMRAVRRGWPLPLGAIDNRRSLVGIDNLVEFITVCIGDPRAANQTFLVSDGHDLSTTALVRGMADAAGMPARLLPVPVSMLRAAATVLGRADQVQGLCGNLQVDSSKARSLLGWVPPVSVAVGLRRSFSGVEKQ
jgi:nucleoside-diphosphate-sugar epimerase